MRKKWPSPPNPDSFCIWPEVTGRTYDYIQERLADMDRRLKVCTRFKKRNFAKEKLLSLGEGVSDFVATSLAKSKKKNFHAIDILEQSKYWEKGEQRYADLKAQWPENYHSGYFQDMNMLTSHGEPLYFSEIIASFSLYFLIAPSSVSENIDCFSNVLNHLKENGSLRVFPLAGVDEKKLISIFSGLLKRGHSITMEYKIEWGDGGFLVLQNVT